MSVKESVLALNNFLTALHRREMRLSMVIEELGFSESEIRFIRDNHLDEFVEFYLGLVRAGIGKYCDRRSTLILIRRFGLDGNPPDTLASLGARLGLSRERVRQLEAKALRKCRHPFNLQTWKPEALREKLNALLAAAVLPPPPAQASEPQSDAAPPAGDVVLPFQDSDHPV